MADRGRLASVADPIEVIIIGGGAVGLSAALELAQRDAVKVTLLEARNVGSGSSSRAVGAIETQYLDRDDIEMRVESKRRFEWLAAEHSVPFRRIGCLRLGHSPADLVAFEKSVAIQREMGVDDATVLTPAEIKRRFPDLAVDDLSGGLYGPSDAVTDGFLYCGALAELATAAGAEIVQRCEVTTHERDASGRHIITAAGMRFEADFVVNAAGGWAGSIGGLLGVAAPILPQRHQVLGVHLARPLAYVMPEVMDYSPGASGSAREEGIYFRPETPSQLVVGVHSESIVAALADPDDYSEGVDVRFTEKIIAMLPARLPCSLEAGIGSGWAGIYPVSPDGQPQVGPCPEDETVISACGVGGFGLQVSPTVGRMVAEWIGDGTVRCVSEFHRYLPGREAIAAGT